MSMRLIAVEIHDFQVNYAAWLGEGDVEKGIQRALNYVNETCYNYPTPRQLRVPSGLYDPLWDYVNNVRQEPATFRENPNA